MKTPKTMKTLTRAIMITAIIFTSSLFTSCSSDDDSPSDPIVGEWSATLSVTEQFENGKSVGRSENEYDENDIERLTFTADNTFSYYYYQVFTLSNGEETIEEGTSSGTYALEGDTIKFSGLDAESQDRLYTLNSSTLTLESTFEYTNSNGEEGVEVFTITYERQ